MTGQTQVKAEMFPVRLVRHYVPLGGYEVLGYNKPDRMVKNAAGQMVVAEKGGWQAGEMHPAPLPGAGFPNKVWAETFIKLPLEEAKAIISKRIAERADELPN